MMAKSMNNVKEEEYGDEDVFRMGPHELRDYQKYLFLEAKKGNIIICLPTGSGKTLIALCLIRHMFKQTIGPYPSEAKRTFFLAPNRVLITQQHKIAETLLPGKITLITGDHNPDNFSSNDWEKCLKDYQIFFLTPAILYDLLVKGYIKINNINLIVFDEMHWATKKKGRDSGHFYNLIMKLYEASNVDDDKKPKILGMSATLIPHKPKEIETFNNSLKKIEQLYHSRVMTKNFERHINHCQEIVIVYKNENNFNIEIDFDFDEICEKYLNHCFYRNADQMAINGDLNNDESSNGSNDDSMIQEKDSLKQFRLAFRKIEEYLYKTMGPWFAIEVIKLYDQSLQSMSFEFTELIRRLMNHIRVLIIKRIEKKFAIENTDDLKLLTDHRLERTTANVLYRWLLQLSKSNENYSFIKPGFICGAISKDFIKFDQPFHYSQYLSLMKSNLINLIVATSAIEEGFDIPICNVVIRYDEPQTYRAYSQSRGRARDKNSAYFLLIPQDLRTQMMKTFADFHDMDNKTRKLKNNVQESLEEEEEDDEIESDCLDVSDSIIKNMGNFKNGPSTLYPLNSLKLVNEYLMKLPRDLFSDHFLPMYQFVKDDNDDNNNNDQMKKYAYVFVAAKIHCAYRTCIHLIQQNEIGDRLNIIDHKFLIKKHHEDLNIRLSVQELQTTDYKKKFSNFSNQLLLPSSSSSGETADFYHLYALEFDLLTEIDDETDSIGQNEQYFKPKFVGTHNSSVGILIKNQQKPFKELCSYFFFNLFPIKFRLIPCGKVSIIDTKFELIKHFHQYHAFDLILEKFRSGRFETSALNTAIMIVLVKRKPYSKQYIIDFDQMEKCRQWIMMMKNSHKDHQSISSDYQRNITVYDPSTLDGEFELYGYLCHKKIELLFKKTNEIRLPTDVMNPGESDTTFQQYFSDKHKRILRHIDQSMVHSKIFRRFYDSFRLIRSIKMTTEKKKTFYNFLPRELLCIYPLSSILCLRIMAIPLIMYRLEQFSLSVEFIQPLCQYGIDVDHCDYHVNYHGQKQFESNMKTLKLEQLAMIDPDSMDKDVPRPKTIGHQNQITNMLQRFLPENESSTTDSSSSSCSENSLKKLFEELFSKIKSFLSHTKNKHKSADHHGRVIAQFNPHQETIDYGEVSIFKFEGNIHETIAKEAIFFDTFDIIQCPNPWQILYGLTLAKAQDLWNIERYETVGDAFIKMTTSLYLYWQYPQYDEYRLTALKMALISNHNLSLIALEKGIQKFIFGSLNEQIHELFFKRISFMHKDDDDDYLIELKSKDLADCIEALIGVFLIHGSASTALAFLEYIDLKAFDPRKAKIDLEKRIRQNETVIITDVHDYNKKSVEEIPLPEIRAKLFDFNPTKPQNYNVFESFYRESLLNDVEEIIDYKFNNKYYLLVAFTHATHDRSEMLHSILIPSYQQLEFCGDAILDHLVTMYLFVRDEQLGPHEISDIRSALVNNMFYAHIMVKFQLYKYIRHSSVAITDSIAKFVNKFRQNSVGTLLELISGGQNEFHSQDIDEIDVPKVLSDVFEALVAAIYLDCEFKLDIVWQVVYRMIIRETHHFLKNRPKMPLSRLYNEYPIHSFSDVTTIVQSTKMQLLNQSEMMVTLTVEPYGTFDGRGCNRRQCRTSAAKKFFTHLRKINVKQTTTSDENM
ncbi:Dicer dimerization domain [Dermatophagoides farinae]|uniref:Dicer dimerization domain n=1 Tax=Dermatophagoides farinae TaxID=6954 RepID=A0A922L5Z9_DERFA|nr:Dicer dimerization domain [Dermatophagoides farinae]